MAYLSLSHEELILIDFYNYIKTIHILLKLLSPELLSSLNCTVVFQKDFSLQVDDLLNIHWKGFNQ
jgi:hypothetical protein